MSIDKFAHPVHMSPRRFGHANVFVGDVNRSVAFYNQVCGLEIVLQQPSIKAGFVSNGNTHHDIGMIQATGKALTGEGGHKILAEGQGVQPGLNHLGWEMESEFALAKAYERAVAAGWKIHRTVRHLSSHSVYTYDPDGNIHEFYADVSKDWRHLYNTETRVSGQWVPGVHTPSMDARYHADPEIRRVAEAPIHPVRITHAFLMARDFTAMRAFFRNGVGLLETMADEDAGLATYSAPAGSYPFVIALVKDGTVDQPEGKRLHHVSFQLPSHDELDASLAALPAKGIKVERTVETAHKDSFYIRDPDGSLLEFYARKPAPLEPGSLPRGRELAFQV